MKHQKYCPVLRRADGVDCTGNGITARHAAVTVITGVPYIMTKGLDGREYYDRPDEKAVERYADDKALPRHEVLMLCDKTNNPIYTPYLKTLDSVYGVASDGEKLVGPCAGGNYVRFDDGNGREVVMRVHDRYDTQEAWDALSK